MTVCTTNWTGERCCGLSLAWNYEACICEISKWLDASNLPFNFFNMLRPGALSISPHAWQKSIQVAKT
jgi:hypothetical protein